MKRVSIEGLRYDQIGIDRPLHARRGKEKLGPYVRQAAMIAALLVPTATIARHDDHRTDVTRVC